MKIDLINCVVGIYTNTPGEEEGNTQVPQINMPVSELPIHIAVNGPQNIKMVRKVGEIDRSRAEEHQRLSEKFKPEVLAQVYPTAQTPMFTKVEELELTREQMDMRSRKTPEAKTPNTAPDEKKEAVKADDGKTPEVKDDDKPDKKAAVNA